MRTRLRKALTVPLTQSSGWLKDEVTFPPLHNRLILWSPRSANYNGPKLTAFLAKLAVYQASSLLQVTTGQTSIRTNPVTTPDGWQDG